MDVPLKDAKLFVEINDMLLFKIDNTKPVVFFWNVVRVLFQHHIMAKPARRTYLL